MNTDVLNKYQRPDESAADRLLADEIASFQAKIVV